MKKKEKNKKNKKQKHQLQARSLPSAHHSISIN